MDEDKVSIITIFYNSSKYLKECISSSLKQTHSNLELILINDASTDNSKKIAKSFNDKRIVYYENKRNLGVVESYNIGINLASGNYISIIDSDDFANIEKIKTLLKEIKKNDSAIAFSKVKFVGKNKYMLNKKLSHNSILILLLYGNPIVHSSILIKSEILKKIKYNKNYKTACDYRLYIDLLENNCKFIMSNEILTYYRIHNNQDTKKKKNFLISETINISNKHIKNLGIFEHTKNLREIMILNSNISIDLFLKTISELVFLNNLYKNNNINLIPFIKNYLGKIYQFNLSKLLKIIIYLRKNNINLSIFYLLIKYLKIKFID